MNLKIDFDNSYSRLPEQFYQNIKPSKTKNPKLIRYNKSLAQELGINLEKTQPEELTDFFSGKVIADGSEPIAQVYAGHQFGYFNPQLGDGRAILLGEIIDKDWERKDIQLKWSGKTKFSRWGDGKAPLWAVIREYILSEAMNALGVPTTRSLAMVTTGEPVYRETVLPGAILTRVASSHIRVGTFEYFLRKWDYDSLKVLTDYTIERHYPEVKESENKYLSFFESVLEKQIKLVAKWMHIGFIHGVMNTDNTSISWETIDYGPCAFMDEYHSSTVFSSIDRRKRYAFENQKHIIGWNLVRLAECLLHLIDPDQEKSVDLVNKIFESFWEKFDTCWLDWMAKKIGIMTLRDKDSTLIYELLDIMEKNEADYTLFFRYLSDAVEKQGYSKVKKLFHKEGEIQAWLTKWETRIKEQGMSFDEIAVQMKQLNPAFIPRNHRVQQAIDEANNQANFILMNQLLDILKNPYTDQPEKSEYMNPPEDHERVHQTFCGT